MKDELLKIENVNVIIVDWQGGAALPNYLAAQANARTVGTKIGDFLTNNLINTNLIHCIGHSLGAHACGFAGKRIILARITGLDPAGPGFKGSTKEYRLDQDDARFVDVINTDEFYGIQDPIGHKYFKNF
jgi:hypothetical protein